MTNANISCFWLIFRCNLTILLLTRKKGAMSILSRAFSAPTLRAERHILPHEIFQLPAKVGCHQEIISVPPVL